MRFIIPILCIVFLMGCGGGAKPPSWYGKDTQDSAYLIGLVVHQSLRVLRLGL